MSESSLLKEIESLKSRIELLESKNNIQLFGRSYNLLGTSNSDLILKTKGQVKVLWGNKYIDIIKDGDLNVDTSFLFKVKTYDKIGSKDGIYVLDDGSIYLKSGSNIINIIGESGNTYVSFLDIQDTTSDLKLTALKNIGFIYDDVESFNSSILYGIVYIESTKKLYIVNNGELSEFTTDFPNPFTSKFIIANSNPVDGSLFIQGTGIGNSLTFDSVYLYSEDNYLNIDTIYGTKFNVNDDNIITIDDHELLSNVDIISNSFKSPNATDRSGFKLYLLNNKSILEIDKLVVRDGLNVETASSGNLKIGYYYSATNESDDDGNLLPSSPQYLGSDIDSCTSNDDGYLWYSDGLGNWTLVKEFHIIDEGEYYKYFASSDISRTIYEDGTSACYYPAGYVCGYLKNKLILSGYIEPTINYLANNNGELRYPADLYEQMLTLSDIDTNNVPYVDGFYYIWRCDTELKSNATISYWESLLNGTGYRVIDLFYDRTIELTSINDFNKDRNTCLNASHNNIYWGFKNNTSDKTCSIDVNLEGVKYKEEKTKYSTANFWSSPKLWETKPWECKLWFEMLWRDYIYNGIFDNDSLQIRKSFYSDEVGWNISSFPIYIRNMGNVLFNGSANVSISKSNNINLVNVDLYFQTSANSYSTNGNILFTVGTCVRTDLPEGIDDEYLMDTPDSNIDLDNIIISRCIPQINIKLLKMKYTNISYSSDKSYYVSGTYDDSTKNFEVKEF